MKETPWGGAVTAPGLLWAGLSPVLVWKNGVAYLAFPPVYLVLS